MKDTNVQDFFLDTIRSQRTPVTIFLLNGVKLQGIVIGHDEDSLMFRRDQLVQLVHKHAISTIMPIGGVSWPKDHPLSPVHSDGYMMSSSVVVGF